LPSTFNVIEFWINSEDEASLYQINEYLYSTPEAMDTDDLPLMKSSSIQSNDAILFSYEDASGERRIFRKEVEDTFVNFKPIITSSNTFSIAEIQSFYYPPPVPRLPNTALPAQGRKPFGGLLRLYK
jgi:hypothetical protein